MTAINFFLLAVGSVILIPATVYFIECMTAVLFGPPRRLRKSDNVPKVAVVIPAHNEQGLIGDTVSHILGQLPQNGRLIVVADNCTDNTRDEAEASGAEVWVRKEAGRRGKGYAISFAVDRLAPNPPEIVVMVDADCRLSDGLIETIARAALVYDRPIQAQYVFGATETRNGLHSISALACLVRNSVRPLGLHHLGYPCNLTGSGMAFPWRQIHTAPALGDNIVEDLVLGLELALAGSEPLLCFEAVVSSDLPASRQSARSQRTRWEHGQIATFLAYGRKLLKAGLRDRRTSLLALAADLAVPPLALLVTLLLFASSVFLGAAAAGATKIPFYVSALALSLVAIATVCAWARFGHRSIPLSALVWAPLYVVWKLPIYLAMLFRRSQKEWNRTERNSSDSGNDEG